MKKIYLYLFLFILLSGCSVNNNQKDDDIITDESTSQESIEEEIIETYVDDNPIKIGLYIYTNGRRLLAENYESSWPMYKDINGFTVYYNNEKEISNDRLQNVWKKLYENYENIEEYKIGYHIEFSTNDGIKSKTILKPSDGDEIFNYVQIYLYDDIHQTGSWYSHMNDSDIVDNTILTTIKLTASTKIEEIISDIHLTAFTYNGPDDFDSLGNYRGNSSFTTILKRK